MLYGIVRNNIYRVAINKIVGSDITMISAVVWYYGSGTDGSIEHLTEKTVNLDKYIGDKESAEDNGLTGGYPNDAPARRE